MSVLGDARTRFASERPLYQQLADSVADQLRSDLREEGVPAVTKGRAKDVASFVGKCLRKNYDDPWGQVTDKAGVRVTVENVGDVPKVSALVRNRWSVVDEQDKTKNLWDEDKVGYGGMHLQVEMPDGPVVGGQCEIQVRSAAQNLWSEMSHRLLYKPGVHPDEATKRALTRLAALMEIFDAEVERSMNAVTAIPGHNIEELVNVAESQFYRFADVAYDRALSRFVLDELGGVLPGSGSERYLETIRQFVSGHEEKLAGIFSRYAEMADPVLIHQPESIVIFERLNAAAFELRAEWADRLPADELESLSAIWGE